MNYEMKREKYKEKIENVVNQRKKTLIGEETIYYLKQFEDVLDKRDKISYKQITNMLDLTSIFIEGVFGEKINFKAIEKEENKTDFTIYYKGEEIATIEFEELN